MNKSKKSASSAWGPWENQWRYPTKKLVIQCLPLILTRTWWMKFAKQGAVPCTSSGEVAVAADVMITSLPNVGIVEVVMVGSEGIFSQCKAGTTIIDMSSVSPSSTLKMAALAKPLGIDYVDAPVSGGTKGAEAGTLTIMVGADDAVFEQIKPILGSDRQ